MEATVLARHAASPGVEEVGLASLSLDRHCLTLRSVTRTDATIVQTSSDLKLLRPLAGSERNRELLWCSVQRTSAEYLET